MVIVFFVDTYGKGKHPIPAAAERFFNVLTNSGHEVRIVGFGNLPDPAYKAKRKKLFLFPAAGRFHGVFYAKSSPNLLEKALQGADLVHNFFPFSMEKKAELAARLHDIPVISSCAMDMKSYQKLFLPVGFSAFSSLTAQLLQFYFFHKYKNILCHSQAVYDELKKNNFSQTLHTLDAEQDSDTVILEKLLHAYNKARTDDLVEYQDKSRQIYKRNWAIFPSTVDPENPYKQGNILTRIRNRICYTLVVGLCTIVSLTFYGLRFKGRRNLSGIKGGAISVSNHLHNIDATMLAASFVPRKITFTSMAGNFKLPVVRWVLKWVGVVPIPSNTSSLRHFFKQTADFAARGGIVHFYPEGSLWQYAKTLRPFKNGAFHVAAGAGVPVIPMTVSLRPPRGLYRLFRRKPLFTVTILPPVYIDESLTGQRQVQDLRTRTHELMDHDLKQYQ